MPLPTQSDWKLRTRSLTLSVRTLLMGIVNITPDSFSDGGAYFDPRAAVDHGLRLLDEGADLLDLGGESTRPNATPLSSKDEQARVLPVLQAILKLRPDAVLSVDTYHAATAQAALAAGAEILNDVSGLLWDEAMAAVLAEAKPGVILMHTRGRPQEWASQPGLAPDEVMLTVIAGLTRSLTLARQAGIAEATLVLDPGFGFGKIGAENLTLLARFAELERFSLPLLAGLSRKRFLVAHRALPTPEEREQATSAAHVAAVLAGAQILRVHEVARARIAAELADAVRKAQTPAVRT